MVQSSSMDLMIYVVQDFLDYSLIKADKFRTNEAQFNIVEAVEKVMCI